MTWNEYNATKWEPSQDEVCNCILIQATLVRFSIVIEKPLVLWANQSVLPELSMHLRYAWVDPAVLGTLSLAPVVSKGTRACCAPGIPAQVNHPFDQNNLIAQDHTWP